MLDLEVVPQQGLQAEQWELLLGMHFSHAVAIIQSQIGIVRSANVVYNDQAPLDHDLILDLPQDGFRLIFDSRSQRLKIIEVYNMKLVRLKYCNTPFNSPGVSPSVEQIDRTFGATRPGSYDKQRQLFALNFRGLIFYFPVDLQYQPHYSHGLGSLRFLGDTTPVLSKLIIYNGHNPSDAPAPPLPESCFKGQTYVEECVVLRNPNATRTLGLRLRLFSLTKNMMDPCGMGVLTEMTRDIFFGDGVQSVVSKLGTPARLFFKSDDKMKIHSKEAHKRVHSTKSDYFFNYLTLGLDILFDAQSNQAIKFILHSNFPGHYDFNSYHRCPFSLRIGRTSPPSTCVSSPIIPTKQQQLLQPTTTNLGKLNPKSPKVKKNKGTNNHNNNNNTTNNNNTNTTNSHNMNNCANQTPQIIEDGNSEGGPGGDKDKMNGAGGPGNNLHKGEKKSVTIDENGSSNNFITISFDSHWEEVNEFVCENEDKVVERPVVLTRSSSNNPFGSSLCYGVQDMIFEVLASNDHVASVTLYQNPDV